MKDCEKIDGEKTKWQRVDCKIVEYRRESERVKSERVDSVK